MTLDLAPRRLGRPPTCTCGSCHKCRKAVYMRGWWNRKTLAERRAVIAGRDQERVRQADVQRSRTRAKQDAIKRSKLRHPERHAARRAVQAALKAGALVRRPCFCGETKVEGHHPDYSKPLEVVWLCRRHHADQHMRAN